jgi:hypothetical protein
MLVDFKTAPSHLFDGAHETGYRVVVVNAVIGAFIQTAHNQLLSDFCAMARRIRGSSKPSSNVSFRFSNKVSFIPPWWSQSLRREAGGHPESETDLRNPVDIAASSLIDRVSEQRHLQQEKGCIKFCERYIL